MNAEEFDFEKSNAYVTANDLVDGLCIREGDMDKRKKPLFLFLLKEIFQDLNLSVIRQTERVLLKVNKNLQCINVPSGYLKFSSIAVPNKHNKFEPLIINANINTDVVDIGASKTCGCDECNCDCSYCSSVRNYEIITSTVVGIMPNGDPRNFTSTTRKKILKDGRYVRETTVPVKLYDNNVHTDTVLQTKTELLCSLEIKDCGCIKNTKDNERLLMGCSDAVSIAFDCGCPVRELPSDTKFYKISDKGSRIHFPDDFPYDTVLLRYYADLKTRELRIPYLAQKTVRLGIKAEETTYSAPDSRENLAFIRMYNAAKLKLADDLTQIKLSDFYKYTLGEFNVS